MRKWLKDIRENKSYSQRDVAKEIGVTRAYYTAIENGSRNPSVKVAKAISNYLDFEWTIFFEDKGVVSTH